MLHLDVNELLKTFLALFIALALGTAIGAERQYRQRTAGLRTNALVALGAAAFVDLAMSLDPNAGVSHVLGYVASGIGFLGAGVIIKDGANIRGLNTAATLWCSAAVGGFAGSGHPLEAALLTCFVLIGNTFLRPLVNLINRTPIDDQATEANYSIHVTVTGDRRDELRDILVEKLEQANYPIRILDVLEREDAEVELVATLTATAVKSEELDAIALALEKEQGVLHATWASATIF